MKKMLCLLALAPMLTGAASPAPQMLSIDLAGLRSTKGRVLVCVTRSRDYFPDCRGDPEQRHYSVRAQQGMVDLAALPPGDYAVSIVHDENGNGKLDTFAGIPREGVGFSRNPTLRFGAPSFKSVRFPLGGKPVEQSIRLKYFL